MTMKLEPAVRPSHFKWGLYGGTGTGKTYTAAKVMSQFILKYRAGTRLAIFDTEPSAGYVSGLVKRITGLDLLAFSSRSFSALMEFTRFCIAEKHAIIIDSVTHPWRSLCADYLEAKKARVKAAGGNPETTRLSLKDWQPLKEMWGQFTELFVYSPVDIVILGREGDVWEEVRDEEGKEEMRKTGTKMKTETELGYEPSLLVQMRLEDTRHFAFVVKDRFDALTGIQSENNPDIAFFQPHIELLDLDGVGPKVHPGKKVFAAGTGPAWETIKARREAILETIEKDILLAYPGSTNEEKKAKVILFRSVFGDDASWKGLETDERKYPQALLETCRKTLRLKVEEIIKQQKESEDAPKG